MEDAENTITADKKVYKSPFHGWYEFDDPTVHTYNYKYRDSNYKY